MSGNPFTASRIRPGAIEYLFAPGSHVAALVQKLQSQDWWGEITGPHGSGKSTLLATLRGPLAAAGRRLVEFELHDGQRRLPAGWQGGIRGEQTLVVVDGYEQLARVNRLRLRWTCRRRAGLLVTAHRSVGLPPLFTTSVDEGLVRRIVARLAAEHRAELDDQPLHALFLRHGGDVREILFALYDLYELRRPRGL